MSEVLRRDHDWAICVLARWIAMWPVGKFSEENKERGFAIWRRITSIGWGPDACERFSARTFSISFAPSVSSDSSYFSSSYHRMARLCMRRHVISVRNPDEWIPWPVSSTFSSPHHHRPWSLRSNWRAARGTPSLVFLCSSQLWTIHRF